MSESEFLEYRLRERAEGGFPVAVTKNKLKKFVPFEYDIAEGVTLTNEPILICGSSEKCQFVIIDEYANDRRYMVLALAFRRNFELIFSLTYISPLGSLRLISYF
ncbi:unnamed protein product [Rhizophagus irregularis]|nr:unnamed protein product [Rhizophagus irregularis]